MKEPLNHQKESVWPEWHQKPIRLTVEEIKNPTAVIEQFFECYHLPDIRNCLQAWLQDALSKDTIESKQHISTHREVEKLVEAAWVINNGTAAGVLKKNRPIGRNLVYATGYQEAGTSEDRYRKEEAFIEKILSRPIEAMQEAFSRLPLEDLFVHLLPNWLRTALINDECPYSDGGVVREMLCEFYDQLLLLIQAVSIGNKNRQSAKPIQPQEWNSQILRYNVPCLSDDQIADPGKVIATFYEKYSIEYVRRELRDFLDAGVGYDGTYPNGFTPWLALTTFEYVLCFTEAAYRLYQQTKTDVQSA